MRIIAAILSGFLCLPAAATNLLNVYQDAQANDPTFQAAHGTYFANRELSPQARAALLPNLSITNTTFNTANVGDNNDTITNGNQSYNENDFTLTATQPIFNFTSWMSLKKADASVKSAEATYNYAAQNLMVRAAQAYINVLQAKDNLTFARAQKRSLKRQMDQARERYHVGLDTMTSVYQAQAQYDTIVAQEMSYENQLFIQFENLKTLTNKHYDSIEPLDKKRMPLVSPKPSNSETWVNTSLAQNYNLLSAKYNKEAARENIKVQEGGHYPTLNLQGSYNNTNNDANVSTQATGNNTQVALNLNLPIYQGGLVVSQTRQAEYQYETACANYQSTYLNTLVSAKTAYNSLLVGLRQIRADRKSVLSSVKSVNSTEAQFNAGTMTMVDVLTAQQQLYQAQTQQATDQYAYLTALLNLKITAGTLALVDLKDINSWLNPKPNDAIIHRANAF